MDSTAAAKPVIEGSRQTNKDRILDAAELEFAARGYEACSLRTISQASGVNLGLLHYYFGSKQAIFSAVFLRRASVLVGRRMELLDATRRRFGAEPIAIEPLISAFIMPTVEMVGEGEGPRAFIKLHSRMRTEPLDFASDLRRTAFNEVNSEFITEFVRSCPHLSRETVIWRFTAMVGAYLFLLSQSGRVEDLSGGRLSGADVDEAIRQTITFVAAGFRGPDDAPLAPAARNGESRKR